MHFEQNLYRPLQLNLMHFTQTIREKEIKKHSNNITIIDFTKNVRWRKPNKLFYGSSARVNKSSTKFCVNVSTLHASHLSQNSDEIGSISNQFLGACKYITHYQGIIIWRNLSFSLIQNEHIQ